MTVASDCTRIDVYGVDQRGWARPRKGKARPSRAMAYGTRGRDRMLPLSAPKTLQRIAAPISVAPVGPSRWAMIHCGTTGCRAISESGIA